MFSFPLNTLKASSCLPLTLMTLNDWAFVSVQGIDSAQYLQGQLSIDVTSLPQQIHRLCAHCDPKGKMWSSLRIFRYGEGFGYIERQSLKDNQISELKKYAVFSKVTIEPMNDAILLGVAGIGAREALSSLFASLPDQTSPVIYQGDTVLLYFSEPKERFLIITHKAGAQKLQNTLLKIVQFNNSQQWLALDIEAGLPIIDENTSGMFIPQAANLQHLDAIDFRKGCYTGQEMIARAQYRGANKRALYWLTGKAKKVPKLGDVLELKMGENWRRTGTILAFAPFDNEEIWVQAILNQDLSPNAALRVEGDENGNLTIAALPY